MEEIIDIATAFEICHSDTPEGDVIFHVTDQNSALLKKPGDMTVSETAGKAEVTIYAGDEKTQDRWRKTGGRIAVFHANKANMITQFTRVMGDAGVNISGMANQSRGEYAYTLLDIDNAASQEVIDGLREATGVYRVRVVK